MSCKRSAVDCESVPTKKERKTLRVEEKMDVIRLMESGERRSDVSKALGLAPSTVTTIMNNAKKIRRTYKDLVAVSSTSSSRMTYSRSETMEKMEKMLVQWVDNSRKLNVRTTQARIVNKAKSLFDEIRVESGSTETFAASKGWFHRFKNRFQISNEEEVEVVEAAQLTVPDEYPSEFKCLLERGGYCPDLVFNVAETGLYWKKLPIENWDESSVTGFKMAKDPLTLLVGGNASGTFKLKPMLVYHTETPRVMKGMVKSRLPVFWRANKTGRMTQTLFSDWYTSYFCPEVGKFCASNGLPPKVMLVLDTAPGHPANLREIHNDHVEVEVVYLPSNATSLLQPMTQGVTATLRAYYLRTTFKGIVEAVQCGVGAGDYWRSYSILNAVTNIDSAWDEVSPCCMNGVWRKLWPEAVIDFVMTEPLTDVVEDVRRMAGEAGIDDVDPDDVNRLLDGHDEPLSREELEQLAAEVGDVEEDVEPIRMLKTKHIRNALAKIRSAFDELCDNDPDWERSQGVQRGVNMMLRPYYNILDERGRRSNHDSKMQLVPVKGATQPGTSHQYR